MLLNSQATAQRIAKKTKTTSFCLLDAKFMIIPVKFAEFIVFDNSENNRLDYNNHVFIALLKL